MRIVICLFGLSLLAASSVTAQDPPAARAALAALLRSQATAQATGAAAERSTPIELPWSRPAFDGDMIESFRRYGLVAIVEPGDRVVVTDTTGTAAFAIQDRSGVVYLEFRAGNGSTESRVRKAVLAEKSRRAVPR